jgi:hypothetical protein
MPLCYNEIIPFLIQFRRLTMSSQYPQFGPESLKEPNLANQPGNPLPSPAYPPPQPEDHPQQPLYYPPYPGVRPENPRVVAVGVMNLVFSFPYLALTLLSILGAANPFESMGLGTSYEMDFATILNLVGFGLGGLLLLLGGANLLARKASGKTLTQVSAGILTAVMAFNLVSSLTNVSGQYLGVLLLSVGIVVGLVLVYPLTAAFVINRTPEELGLE